MLNVKISRERDKTIDIIKGICVLSVVIGHVWSIKNIGVDSFYGIGRRFIYSYQIVGFLFCSGFLFKNEKTKVFLKKKIKSLYIPSVIFQIISLLLYPLLFGLGIVGKMATKQLLTKLFNILLFKDDGILMNPIWFLTYMFVALIVFFGIFKLTQLLKWKYALIFFSVLAGVVGYIGVYLDSTNPIIAILNRYYFFQALLSIVFITMGYYCRKFSIIDRIKNWIWVPLAMALILLVWYVHVYIELKFGEVGGRYFYINSFIGIAFVVSLAKCISTSEHISYIMIIIGQSGLVIMAFHRIVFKLLDAVLCNITGKTQLIGEYQVAYPNLWLIYTIVSIIVIILIRAITIALWNKICIDNK